jgi:prepilin-type N-terminal cleavage/methylation domain-containing protein
MTSRGVTLIELLVVLAILGVALALVSPSLFRSMDRFALDSTGHQLVNTFRMARYEARLGQRELLGMLSRGEFVLTRGSDPIKSLQLPNSIEVQSSEKDAAYAFLPSGQILGPERLTLVSGARSGALILGPPPGTVRFEMDR